MGARVLRGEAGWSKRQVALASGVSVSTIWNLVRVGLLPETLSEVDVLLARVAAELGATRPTNRENVDDRTAALMARDRAALHAVRAAASAGLDPQAVLLVSAVLSTPAVTSDPVAQLAALRDAALQADPLIMIPVGAWWRASADAGEDAA